ncbi:MAG: hypothetical protein DRH12_14710 [Deltaproteobacteria bacterium]|nr:MAG: hypothetical protein DRH12_14710 [Deltaproteobacteria bacterium]
MGTKKIFLILPFVVTCLALTQVAVAASEQEAQTARAMKYFQEIAEYVVKGDAKAIFQRMTPAAKAKVSEKNIATFLHQFLDGLGNPKGMSITGFNLDPKEEFCQIKGRIDYEKEDLALLVIMKHVDDGFQIQYLHLELPNSRHRLQQLAQGPKKFLKYKFFPTLKNQGIDEALALIDRQVRQQVGDDLIKAILASLRRTTIKSIMSYNVDQGTKGKIHKFLLLGEYNGSPCEVEILLKPKGEQFVVLDVNLRLLDQG